MTDQTPEEAPTPPGGPPETAAPDGWRQDKQGRWITPARGRSGVVYRQGNETVEEAHARDAKGPKDKRPKRRAKIPKAPAPTQVSLQELEHLLIEALSAPAMVAAMQGDEWAADHFTSQAPTLARNLTKAAEHNPWLRAKLEAFLEGDILLVKVMTLFPVAAALVGYAVPPIIYYLDPPFIPAEAREMFRVPEREKKTRKDPPDAESTASPAPAPPAAGPPGAELAQAA